MNSIFIYFSKKVGGVCLRGALVRMNMVCTIISISLVTIQLMPYNTCRLTFFICSVGFTSPMLFDEKKYPYHLMLQKFLSCGGQDAMFE